jgi:Na+/proline symporter
MGMIDKIDIAVLVGYLALLLFIGWRAGRKKSESTAENFFLTNNTLPW